MRLIRLFVLIVATIGSDNAVSYMCFGSFFEVDEHCYAGNRLAWFSEPTYLMELQLWGDLDGKPYPTNQVYDELAQGVLQWNNFLYNNIETPGRTTLAIFANNNPAVIQYDDASSIIFSTGAVDNVCGPGNPLACEVGRSFGIQLTGAHGGIDMKRTSDIFLKDGPWSIPPITQSCVQLGWSDIVGTISHEIGHGLGLAHKSREGQEPHPVMENEICSQAASEATPRYPILTDMQDVDFLYGLTGGLNQTSIIQPENGTTITWLSELISFLGSAIDPAGNDVSSQIRWVSSIQGLLGIGEQINDVTMVPGLHTITADISQSTGEFGEFTTTDSMPVDINHVFDEDLSSIGFTTSAIIINVEGPIVDAFDVHDDPCFIMVPGNSCVSTIDWSISGSVSPGQLLLYQNNLLISSGQNGSLTVNLLNGINVFELRFLDTAGIEHILSSLNALAGVINANIAGPTTCEIDPPPQDRCALIAPISGFAPNVYVYNDENDLLYESNVNGYFQTDLNLDIPAQGDYIKIFYKEGNQSILLDAQSYTTFRIADQYEDDDFVKNPHSLNTSFGVANIFLNQTQVNHNFHKYSDIDFIRIPFPTNLGMSSLRTVNLSNSISTSIEMGCVMQSPTGWRYQKLSGPTSGSESDGLQVGSSVYNWPTGNNRPECGGDAYFAKITRSDGPIGENSSYDVIYLNALEDLYEPDDQPSDAKSVVIDEFQDRNFSIDRIDYVTFTPTSGSNFNFNLSSGSSFVNPCITISSNNSIIANDCMSGNSIDINFEANTEVLIKIENTASRVATEYQILINTLSCNIDLYEQDDIIPSIFSMPEGNTIQYRNFVDDSNDYFTFNCNCPTGTYVLNKWFKSAPISNNLCIQDHAGGTSLCPGSFFGCNTSYQVGFNCICSVTDPSQT